MSKPRIGVLLAIGVVASVGIALAGALWEQGSDRHAAHAQGAGGGGQVRTYYIAAEEVSWDFAPQGRNLVFGRRFGETEDVFLKRGPTRIGRRHTMALYREYTDARFRVRKPRPERWRHLGNLGPVIRAEVGDTIRVVFLNRGTKPYSMHPHGVFYGKASEGTPYSDGGRESGVAAPGRRVTYTWKVPERAGPGPHDGNSMMWMYHGHVDEVADTNSGLNGVILVNRRGHSRPDGTPDDVDREFVGLFTVFDQNAANYLDRDIARLRDPSGVDRDDEDFEESNLKHAINGYLYGNVPGGADADAALFRMRRGERVRWYLMGMGTEVDIHTPHWHGNVVTTHGGMRTDVTEVFPATMISADMVADNPGIWLFHCHVNDHLTAGMVTRYEVE